MSAPVLTNVARRLHIETNMKTCACVQIWQKYEGTCINKSSSQLIPSLARTIQKGRSALIQDLGTCKTLARCSIRISFLSRIQSVQPLKSSKWSGLHSTCSFLVHSVVTSVISFSHLRGCGIDISAVGQEHLDQLVVSGGGRDDQRRPSVVVHCVHSTLTNLGGRVF